MKYGRNFSLTVPVLPSGTHIRPDNRCWGQKWPWQKAGEKRAADKR